MTDKSELRKKLLALKIGDTEEKSRAICRALIESPQFLTAKSVFVYLSTGSEVGTDEIISAAFRLKKRVFVPVTDTVMRTAEIKEGAALTVGKFGIRTPIDPDYTGEISDLTVVPMLGFDRNLTRLGRGGGYYDRYLADKKTFKVGLCYADRELTDIPSETYDIKMDIIITERGMVL